MTALPSGEAFEFPGPVYYRPDRTGRIGCEIGGLAIQKFIDRLRPSGGGVGEVWCAGSRSWS